MRARRRGCSPVGGLGVGVRIVTSMPASAQSRATVVAEARNHRLDVSRSRRERVDASEARRRGEVTEVTGVGAGVTTGS
jgi:hypothetical protein